MTGKNGPSFEMFSTAHLMAIVALCFFILLLFISRKKRLIETKASQRIERFLP